MLILQNISYIHPNKDLLFSNIHVTVNHHEKAALIGNNGLGKSTLLKIIATRLLPASGHIVTESKPYYVPQHVGQFNDLTIAQALQIEDKRTALQTILNGNASDTHFDLLNDDWNIEERCAEALNRWQLHGLDLSRKMGMLSGGQKTKVFLAGIAIHQASLVLLDEPSNHLDLAGRQLLYEYIKSTKSTMLVVSHDKTLLRLLDSIYELSNTGITAYGGDYAFYLKQKNTEQQALNQQIQDGEKALRKAKEKERETLERKQKLDHRGKNKQEKAGVARIMMNTLRNNAERSASKLKTVHRQKIEGFSQNLEELRASLPDIDKIKFGFAPSILHKGKVLFSATDITLAYQNKVLWKEGLSLQIKSGERIAFAGKNGSGKTSLINLILGNLEAQTGTVYRAQVNAIYIDQDYSLLNPDVNVYQQAEQFNAGALEEYEVKIRLHRFLFGKTDWEKPCGALSGGERMRLLLCCLTLNTIAPDMIVLDEPTNNLDIQNVEILSAAINNYHGTLIVVSHDEPFMQLLNIERCIEL